MIPVESSLFYVALSLYLLSAISFFLYLLKSRQMSYLMGVGLTVAAFASHTALLLYRFITLDFFPVTDLHQSLVFFVWSLVAVFLIIHLRYKILILGAFVIPLAALFFTCSAANLAAGPVSLPPALQSFWLPVHTTLAFIGDALFGLAFCVGVMYLIQEKQIKRKKWTPFFHRLPSLQTLDDLNYFCIRFGFPFLTLGIITGSIWAEYTWGSYWSWDPKETWALITWFIYAALLHGRFTTGWRGKRAALFSIIGFCAVVFTFLGVNLLLPGLHSYESHGTQIPFGI